MWLQNQRYSSICSKFVTLRIVAIGLFGYAASMASPPASYAFDEVMHRTASPIRAQPSMSTEIVTIQSGTTTYHIPRNYIIYPFRPYPVIRVTFPGFKPMTDATRRCLEGREPGCIPIDLVLLGRGDAGNYKQGRSQEEKLDSWLSLGRNFPKAKKLKGPFGYTIYSRGPSGAESQKYTKYHNQKMILFDCFVQLDVKSTVCSDTAPINDDIWFHITFRADQIGNIELIESETRALMQNFSETRT